MGDKNEDSTSDRTGKTKSLRKDNNDGKTSRTSAAAQEEPASHPASALSLCYLAMLGSLGSPDLVLLYYCLPSFLFVALYSILPHKVSTENPFYHRIAPVFTLAYVHINIPY